MTISSIKYESQEHVNVCFYLDERTILLGNGKEKTFSEHHSGVYKGTRNWTKYVQPYLDEGGIIIPYEDTISLANYKKTTITENKKEAGAQIALLFGTVEDGVTAGSNKLMYKEMHDIAEHSSLVLKVAQGINDIDDDARLAVLGALMDDIDAIISAENVAATAVNAVSETVNLTADKTTVDAVSVPWPLLVI